MKKLLVTIMSLIVMSTYGQQENEEQKPVKLKWVNSFQLGQMFSNNEGVTGTLSASYLSGVKRNRITAAIELGYNDYELFKLGSTALVGMYKVKKSGISPYLHGSIGYGLPLYFKDDSQIDATSSEGGILTGGGFGVDFPLGKASLILQLGYKFQKTTYDEPNFYYYGYDLLSSFAPGNIADYSYTTRKMHRVEFKIGMMF